MLTVVAAEDFLLKVVRLAHVGKDVEALSHRVRDPMRRVPLVAVVLAVGVLLLVAVALLHGRESLGVDAGEVVPVVGGVKFLRVHTEAVEAAADDHAVAAAAGLVVGVRVAVLVDARVLAAGGAPVARGVGRVVVVVACLVLVLVVAAHLLGSVAGAIAAVCLPLEEPRDACGLLVRGPEGAGDLGALVVLDVVGLALGGVDQDFIGGLRADELCWVGLHAGLCLVGMVLKGQLVEGLLDGGGIGVGLDAQGSVVINERSHRRWNGDKYKCQ